MPDFLQTFDTSGSHHVTGLIDEQGNLRPPAPVGRPTSRAEGGAIITWRDLDPFTRGYIEALFFTNEGDGEPGTDSEAGLWYEVEPGQWSSDFGFADLAPNTLRTIMADCADFQKNSLLSLQLAYDYELTGYTPEQAGRDFWFTRNGHGTGFWDRGLGLVGEALSGNAKLVGEVDAYVGDDGKVYL